MIKATVGTRVTVTLPYSEVCMHMRVAGKTMAVDVLAQGAQLIDAAGMPFSFPITHGEAGIDPVYGPDVERVRPGKLAVGDELADSNGVTVDAVYTDPEGTWVDFSDGDSGYLTRSVKVIRDASL